MKPRNSAAGIFLTFAVFMSLFGSEVGRAAGHDQAGKDPAETERPLSPVLVDGKVGYINQAGRIVIEPQFEPLRLHGSGVYAPTAGWGIWERYCHWACDFFEGRSVVHKEGRLAYIDTNGQLVTPFAFTRASHFDRGVASVQQGDKCGLIDRDGNWIAPPRFDWIRPFVRETAEAKLNGRHCLIDKRGTVLKYRRPSMYYPPLTVAGISLARGVTGKWGLTDAEGRFVLEPQFDDIRWLRCLTGARFDHKHPVLVGTTYEYSDVFFPSIGGGLAAVRRDGEYGLVTDAGKVLVPPRFDEIDGCFCEGRGLIKQNGKYGYVDPTGKIVIPAQFEYAERFLGNIARVKTSRGWGFITRNGRLVVHPSLDKHQPGELVVSEGRTAVWGSNKKIGYVDTQGRMIIEPQFDAAEPFRYGLARVNLGGRYLIDREYWHGGKWGYIDKTGKWIWTPTN